MNNTQINTQKKAAEFVGVKKATVTKWENEGLQRDWQRNFDPEQLIELAKLKRETETEKKTITDQGMFDPSQYLSIAEEIQLRGYVRKQLKNSLAAGGKSARPAMDYVIVILILDTGLRTQELVHLKIRDTPAHHGHDQINISEGTYGITRSIIIRPEISNMIRDYVENYRRGAKPTSTLFASEREHRRMRIYSRERKKGKTVKTWDKIEYSARVTDSDLRSRLKRICRKAGLPMNLTLQMMRHTFGIKLYGVAHDVYNVQRQLGYKDFQQTKRYCIDRHR